MNKLILSIRKRFLIPVVVLVTTLAWLTFCRSHYESYWNGTIHKVQTVDFNILHHTLPPTLSLLIMAGRDDEVQKVLDCNYGIFGLVVTDPEGTDVLFRTKAVYKKETWQKFLSLEHLKKLDEPYDLLTDPPPLSAQHTHESPRVDRTKAAGPGAGRVLGRVYYVRGVPPAFEEDLVEAVFSNWFEMAGSKRGYILLSMIAVATASLVVSLILWRQRILNAREQELAARENELAIKRRALNQLNTDLVAQRQKKEWLEQEAEIAYQRALRLKESLVTVKHALYPDDALDADQTQGIMVRPPQHAASQLMGEVEAILPELMQNAMVLKSQAQVWQTYCCQLEQRQSEMENLLRQQQVYWQTPRVDAALASAETATERQLAWPPQWPEDLLPQMPDATSNQTPPVNIQASEPAAKFP